MKTAVIYLRVSTEKQRHGHSFARQFDYCKSWCRDNNIKICGVITECCSGYSGEHVKRDVLMRHKKAQLGKFLNKLDDGLKTDYLVFEEWDRFSRLPVLETMELRDKFKSLGVQPVSVGLDYPYTYSKLSEQELQMINNIGWHELEAA